jgi:hypothetical protein
MPGENMMSTTLIRVYLPVIALFSSETMEVHTGAVHAAPHTQASFPKTSYLGMPIAAFHM